MCVQLMVRPEPLMLDSEVLMRLCRYFEHNCVEKSSGSFSLPTESHSSFAGVEILAMSRIQQQADNTRDDA